MVPTYKRAHLLGYVLDGLANQSYKNFEVLVVVKPSGDGTDEVVTRYSDRLILKLIKQRHGGFLDALNLGLEHVTGQIILFLDDDAIPFPELVQGHVDSYGIPNVGGVSGDVLEAPSDRNEFSEFRTRQSQIFPKIGRINYISRVGMKVWNKPLEGQENFFVYISKAGVASINATIVNAASRQITKSLLVRGANMSVLSAAIDGFRFPTSCILGLTNEQYLGWHLWKKGFNQVFNSKLRIYHIEHGQTLSRSFKETKRETLLYTEEKLFFYRLKGLEPRLSIMHRVAWLIFKTQGDIQRICLNRELHQIAGLKSTFYSTVIGFKLLLKRRFHLAYSPIVDLKKIRE